MTKPLNVNEPVQTRDGRMARIVCTDIKGRDDCIGALVLHSDGDESFHFFYPDGRYRKGFDRALDLINVPKRIQGWVNVYPGIVHKTREGADIAIPPGTDFRIACIYIDIPEGEGL